MIALLNFYIFSFVFSGLTLLTLSGSSPVGGNEITIAYLSLLSFISLLPLTFYLSYKLVRSLELNEIIDEYLIRLSFDKIFLISKNNMIIESTIESDDHSTLVDMVENDSLSVLYNFIINQIQSNNIIKSQLVL
ncbi:MAG: hypothetical protein IPP25_01230 [Saprospiraceae bacterium]|nr:hypothetical protein [Candidatus Opimibacter skivensis]